MIKRNDRENGSTLRILKVLENKDYLAIDHLHNYSILSPIETKLTKNTALLKSRLNTCQHSQTNIIAPSEIISMNGISYYIINVGINEAFWIKDIEPNKLNNPAYTLTLFEDAVRKVLKTLLLWKLKQLREYLNIKNFMVIRGSLYFLLLPRGRTSHISLKRSQRFQSKSLERNNERTTHECLSNEFEIIKEFGILLQDVFYDALQNNERQNQTKKIIGQLLKQMTRKEVTFQYVEIKLDGIKIKKKGTASKKLGFIHYRQLTHSMSPDNQSIESNYSKKRSFLSKPYSPNNLAQVEIKFKRKALSSSSQYDPWHPKSKSQKSKLLLTEPDVSDTLTPKNKFVQLWKNRVSKGIQQKQRYRDWLSNSKFELSLKQRLKKQNEIARQKFIKSIQKHREYDDKIKDESFYNTKLKAKLSRLKTEYKRDNISATKLEEALRRSELDQDFHIAEVARKLNFTGEIIKLDNIEQKLSNQKKNPPIDERLIVNEMNYSRQYHCANSKESISQNICEATFTKEVQSQRIEQKRSQFDENNVISVLKSKQSVSKTIEGLDVNQKNQFESLKEENSPYNQLMKKQSEVETSKSIKSKRFTSKVQPVFETDQIQEVKIGWSKEKQYPPIVTNNFIKPNDSQHFSKKPLLLPKNQRYDPVAQSFEEYLTMINIMGNICVKSVKNRNALSSLSWRKPVYFIYERFCYQRDRIVKCLELGACQVFRKNKKIDFQEWQEWLISARQNRFMQKLSNENNKIRGDLNKFAEKLLQTANLSKKLQHYIRNRESILQVDDSKTRQDLSKLSVGTVVQLYDTIVDKKISRIEIINFFLDCLFGVKIISQLDTLCPEHLKVVIKDYQNYDVSNQDIHQIVDSLYMTYFRDEIQKRK